VENEKLEESMSNGAAAAAAHAAIANAIKASGVLVKVDNKDFVAILQKSPKPLVVSSDKGFWSRSYKYLTSYKGLAFYTKSRDFLSLPSDTELVKCKEMSIPS
jgi:hypothetical protein